MTAIEDFKEMCKQYPPELGVPKPSNWDMVITRVLLEVIELLERSEPSP